MGDLVPIDIVNQVVMVNKRDIPIRMHAYSRRHVVELDLCPKLPPLLSEQRHAAGSNYRQHPVSGNTIHWPIHCNAQ